MVRDEKAVYIDAVPEEAPRVDTGVWRLGDQVGFLLRRAQQRHLAIFAERINDLTPTQFSTLAILAQEGSLSQNELGRRTAMDTATIKGVVDRLRARGLVETARNPLDKRRLDVQLTSAGAALISPRLSDSAEISASTLEPLTTGEAQQLIELLRKIG
ncbi:MAG: MarR family transcriptional regulator [Rhodobacteraceae bacterium]|nr:MarR family transcriptional regulator [Paracoccaceae bacterium]